MSAALAKAIERRWYSSPGILWLLYPLALLFRLLSYFRRRSQTQSSVKFAVPVCIVGNIAIGGTGKTPTIIALVHALAEQGITAGVVARGYGASLAKDEVRVLDANATAAMVGDEPLLIYKRTGCAVAVGSNRVAACEALLKTHAVDVILSDDGMQHYNLGRDLELALVDGERVFGNAQLLPVGPLREHPKRLQSVNWLLVNGGNAEHVNARLQALRVINTAELSSKPNKLNKTLAPVFAHLEAVKLVNLANGKTLLLQNITELGAFVAVAGIGNPSRFFNTLKSTGITGFDTFSYPDHHKFTSADFRQFDSKAIVMTEKDAVKCTPFATDAMWYVPVDLKLPQTFIADFCAQIRKVIALYN